MFADLLALKVQLFHSVWPGADIIPIDSNMDTYFKSATTSTTP